MSAFRFRLERVLAWYRERCQQEEDRLAACLAAVTESKAAIVRLQAEHWGIERELVSWTALAATDLIALGLYRLRVRKEELDLNLDLERRERASSEQRAKLMEARRRLQLVEKLRARRLAEYTYQADRALEQLGADAFLSRWSREHSSKGLRL
jgi:hypothetical protein